MSSKSASPRKKKGHEEHEEHVNHERWLVSYADMLTLLFVLFVVLFAMSNVDKAKFEALADSLSAGFGGESVAFSGKAGPMNGAGADPNVQPLDPGVDPGLSAGGNKPTEKQKKAAADRAAVAAAARNKASRDAQAAIREVKNLREVQRKITEALTAAKLQDSVRFTIDSRGLVITIVTNEVTFEGNRAELRSGGQQIMHAIGPTLRALPNNLQVDGHTNQLNVSTGAYPSGWELSTARASTVVRYLNGQGIAATRLSAAGYSDTRPLIDPRDPRSITRNRRVDVVVLSSLPADQRELLPIAAGTGAAGTGATSTSPTADAGNAAPASPTADTGHADPAAHN